MQCPICSEEMVSEIQIERHIEDVHDRYNSDRTLVFAALRDSHIGHHALNVQRLETRLRKLLRHINKVEQEYTGIKRFFLDSARRQLEQELVQWEEEEPIARCRICRLKFSYFVRKHHCRLCGQVVCGDIDRNCSREVPSDLLAAKVDATNGANGAPFPLRICETCRNSLFGHKNYLSECAAEPPQPVQVWRNLKRRKTGIDALIPEFQRLVGEIANGAKDPETLAKTKHARTELYAALAHYERATKKLLPMENETATESRLRQNMLLNATEYLQQVMVPLQAVPQIMQSQEQPRIRKDEAQQLQNKLVVLQEQLYMVEGMVSDAKRKRHFDELPPLEQSQRDLQQEIDAVVGTLGNLAPRNI